MAHVVVENNSLFDDTIAVAGSSDRQLNTSGTDVLSLVDTMINVRGRVVDEKGEPIEGVSVRVKGSTTGRPQIMQVISH